jgi:hypothetical protein
LMGGRLFFFLGAGGRRRRPSAEREEGGNGERALSERARARGWLAPARSGGARARARSRPPARPQQHACA